MDHGTEERAVAGILPGGIVELRTVHGFLEPTLGTRARPTLSGGSPLGRLCRRLASVHGGGSGQGYGFFVTGGALIGGLVETRAA